MADQRTKHNHYLHQVVLPEELKHVLQRKVINRDGRATERSPRSLPDFEQTLTPCEQRSAPLNHVLNNLKAPEQEARWQEDSNVLHPGLVGLCFSGGGIRSATFNLGVIQGLKKSGLLNCVDYLSTVSGGGYMGAALASTMSGASSDSQNADKKEEAVSQLFTHRQGDVEPSEFRHLRNNSNYMAPNGGLDTIRVPAIFLRGIVLNALVVLPYLLMFAMLTAMLVASPLGIYSSYSAWLGQLGVGTLYPITKTLIFALVINYIVSSITTRFSEALPAENQSWRWRNTITYAIAINVAAVFGSAVIETQPLALSAYQSVVTWSISLQQMGLSGVVIAALCSLVLAKIVSNLRKVSNQLVVGIIGLSAVFACWLVVLDVGSDLLSGHTSYQGVMVLCVVLLLLNHFTGSANFTAVNRFYRDRLSKAYIFRKSGPSPQAPVEHTDNIKLSELDSDFTPFSIINCTVNTEQTNDAYRKDRHGDNFVFTKCYSGSNQTGYCKTEDLEATQPSINLGTATAISGAAVAPNMGRNTVKALTFLLAMLNIRYDFWVKHPSKVRQAASQNPLPFWKKLLQTNRVGPSYFLRELVGKVDTNHPYINLSDGGHFENLGLYELVRRECRLIIVSDAETDPSFSFSGLMDAIRMVQTDFGIKISISGLDKIRAKETAYAVGEIDYQNGRKGQILYIKSTMIQFKDDESAHYRGYFDHYRYIANYQSKNPEFPNQSSGDQFFDEAQFEAYRALGYEVASQVLFTSESSTQVQQDSFSGRRSA
ncbi:patatin-like phospholipase family protein [Vibrio sp. SCSIO 43132]|uniref:patatin-like phospholipase family protein n=1 Tax=Vibrio sp. SCSIO 43132 TaxID=2779363 RepID=UPI001CA9F817|nr:patatin-like phospholipase family protein [Vibrio sp. SCSIO 43132]UAB71502.1 patatin-like phospholipase family protein [Vibrio sp. SCSIO 43132]